jgi:AhpD family alkylhydroperoxidase
MAARLNYGELAPEALAHMRALEHYLNTSSGLDLRLLELVRLRVSLMNDCEYCIGLHTGELRKHGETEERIAAAPQWWTSALFSDRERAGLAWAEAITNIQEGHAPDEVYRAVEAQFTAAEIVHLTFVLTTINAWNRIAISLGDHSRQAANPTGAATQSSSEATLGSAS